jgi:hypothetical protein
VTEFNYIDIFATKGFEYLLVIGFFLVLVAFWSFLNVPKKEIRRAQAEREDLRRLLDLQRENMESELGKLRNQRDTMQYALLAQLQLVENRAIVAWHETHPEQAVPSDLGKLLDWVLAERDALAEDRVRLDYLGTLVQCKPSLYHTPGPEGSIVVDAADDGYGEGGTLREAIDAARKQRAA